MVLDGFSADRVEIVVVIEQVVEPSGSRRRVVPVATPQAFRIEVDDVGVDVLGGSFIEVVFSRRNKMEMSSHVVRIGGRGAFLKKWVA